MALAVGCQTPGSAPVDPSVCTDQVTLAQQDIARATDASQAYSPVDRVLTAVSAEDNLRGCGGAMADIMAARAATCRYLPMTLPGQYPAGVASDLQRRCCPPAETALRTWCAGYDAGL